MLENKIKNYAQWFPGSMNDVSDALSRDDDRSDEELTNVFRSFTPSQIPDHFKIVPLPSKISSWLTSLLQRLTVKEQLRVKHTRTKLGRGQGGKNTAVQSELSRVNSLTTSGVDKESYSWMPLSWLSVKGGFQDNLMTPWLKAQSEVPSHLSHRPSGKMTGQTRKKTRMANLEEFYLGNTGHLRTAPQIQHNKRPSQSVSLPKSPKRKERRLNEPQAN